MAVSAGLIVATTASAHNHGYVRSLGATHVFDYNHTDVVQNILELLKPGDFVFDAMGYDHTQKVTAEIVSRLGGGKLPTVRWPVETRFKNVEIEAGMCCVR